MTKDIINETRFEEWVVIDGRTMVGSTFIECILESRGLAPASFEDCNFWRCDLVPSKPGSPFIEADLSVTDPKPEPEVLAKPFRWITPSRLRWKGEWKW